MFDGALGKGAVPRGRVWVGSVISVGLHAGLLTGAIWLSSGGEVTPAAAPDFRGPVRVSLEHIPRGTPAGAVQRPAAQPVKPRRKRRPPQTPVVVSRPAEVEPPPEAPEPPAEEGEGDEPVTGMAIGPSGQGTLGHPEGSCEGPDCLTEVPAHVGPLDYQGGTMTPPVMLGGRPPAYTRQALEARVEGMMIVKCVITREGALRDCRMIKGLPFMEEEVLQSLATRRYRPVTVDGVPVDVNYVFNIRLKLPH